MSVVQYEMRKFATVAHLRENYKSVRARFNQPTIFGPEPAPAVKRGKDMPVRIAPPEVPASSTAVDVASEATAATRPRSMVNAAGEKISVAVMVAAAAAHFGIPREALLSERRTGPISYARQHVMYLAREEGWSMPQVGKRLGGKDHTTVLHGFRKIRDELADGKPSTIANIEAIRIKMLELCPDIRARLLAQYPGLAAAAQKDHLVTVG